MELSFIDVFALEHDSELFTAVPKSLAAAGDHL